ncbi:MAG: glycoside hydrolase N-terminal domain-containing protein [Acidobacteria bacterium]|nr:glycoside hydrolase N-terminal domain-containing protein [Acidobacteriota bacterium]
MRHSGIVLSGLWLSLGLATAAEPFRLTLAAPIDRWDEAIPLGNGLMGGLLWGSGNELRLSLDRGDLWDLRPHPAFVQPGFKYAKVVELAAGGRTEELNKLFSRVSDFPTKLPGARLVLTLDSRYQSREFSLDMKQAIGAVKFEGDSGGYQATCFFSATEPVALIFVPGAARLSLVANTAVKTLGYQPPAAGVDARQAWLVQDAALGFRYAILAASRPVRDGTLTAVAITTNKEAPDPLALARQRTAAALDQGYEKMLAPHVQWWNAFWGRSSIQVPDDRILQHYNLVEYFYGAASRRGAPPMPLQGVWTADEGNLPPWHGDYHHDLNTQLTYWACLASGHFDECRGLIDFMNGLKPAHEAFARGFYGLQHGIVVPGVMSLDGSPMGAWFQYTLSPTMGAWVAQAFYWQWRYEMDPDFLARQAYPYCAAIGQALAALLQPDPQSGRLKLPLSSSPEIHNNSQRAWLKPNSNFDLALLRWLFAANAEMAAASGQPAEADRWNGLLARLDPLAVSGESGPLLMAPGEPLAESHRHHSQLMAIHPLGILNVEGSSRDREIIASSFAQIDALGTRQWTGYSFSWMAALRARAGRGNEALRFLSDYVESFALRNGFHVNGEQTRKGLSDLHYRPFTLEGNFAAAQAVHEMLLQSWGGRLRVFPAMPWQWSEASFDSLRAEGGFSVSAERWARRTRRVAIRAIVDQPLRLQNPFDGPNFESSRPVEQVGGEIRCTLRAGETLELRAAPSTRPESAIARRLKWVGVAVEEPDHTIWGAAPLLDRSGQVHLYVARWPEANVDPAWRKSSEIAHYVAPGPEGPFRFSDVALRGTGRNTWDRFGPHNPEIRFFDGKYVLLYVANPDYRQPPHPLNQSIGMAVADSPAGPWRKAARDGLILTASPDPAHFTHGRQVVNPTLLQVGGRFYLYFKTSGPVPGSTVYGLAISDRLEGPYVMNARPVTSEGVTIEDATAFEWDGKICLLTTDNHGKVTGVRGGGALWVSEDGVNFRPEWTQLGYHRIPAYYPAYQEGRVKQVYGGDPKFERPKVLVIEGKPAYLYATSGWNVTGGARTVSHVLKLDLQPTDGPLAPLPRVLIIGDSISIGYTPELKRLLQGKAVVEHNPGNAGHTGRGIENLDRWLGSTRWDVIHFNWGLWDLAYRPNGSKDTGLDKVNGIQSWPLPAYEQHLRELVQRLKKTGARLVWATTTPVPDNEPGRFKGDEVRYNETARRIMRENGIPVDDLYEHMLPHAGELALKPGNVHYSEAGYAFLARRVAAAVEKELDAPARLGSQPQPR